VSDASHELKTPLASIRLLSDSILQTENMDGDMVNEFVTDIGNEADRLTRTTEKLLRLTRLDSEIDAAPERIDMERVVKETARSLMPLADQSGVTLTYQLSSDCYIKATEDDMHQVVFNLAENGIKYNMPGGEVQILLFKTDNVVQLIVNDTGIGIPEEDVQHIFDRFYRVDKARSREAGGSGLGLSIVHDTVVGHGGSIRVEHRVPRGTSFIVAFPYCEAKEEAEQ
jgi:signal transduction histidine kinase